MSKPVQVGEATAAPNTLRPATAPLHARLPWAWNEYGTTLMAGAESVLDIGGGYDGQWGGKRPSDADAEFIVRAANAHDDLLAACKEFVRKCECGEARSRRSYAQMKAAIAKAEGVTHVA